MTEEEWLTGSNPASLLDFLRGKASNRKARLYTVWCCRQCERFPDTRLQAAINLAERLEDASKKQLTAAVAGVWEVLTELDPVDSEPYLLPEYVAIELLEDRYSIEDASNNPYSMASYAQTRSKRIPSPNTCG